MEPDGQSVLPRKNSYPVLVQILIASVGAALLAGSAVYYVENNQAKSAQADLRNQIATLQKQISAAQPLSSHDPYADWQLYTNSALGISFKYPHGYYVEMSAAKANTIVVSNHRQSEVTGIENVPADWVAMDIYANSTQSDWSAGFTTTQKRLSAITSTSEKTENGSGEVMYYTFYSSQASGYSLIPGTGRLEQMDALLKLGNGKVFRAGNLDNYDWTPAGSDEKGAALLLQILRTAS